MDTLERISTPTDRQLFALHLKLLGELHERGILSSANNPTGDLAEYLFCTAFKDWKRANKSQANFDAIGPAPTEFKYQIKGRRITSFNKSRQLSAIRGLEAAQHFDILAGVLFNEDYSVLKAALIPHGALLNLFKKRSHISFQAHTHSYVFLLVDGIWKVEGVEDVTLRLKSAWY
jgi:hypothetical protein